jgi:hypothetical protein
LSDLLRMITKIICKYDPFIKSTKILFEEELGCADFRFFFIAIEPNQLKVRPKVSKVRPKSKGIPNRTKVEPKLENPVCSVIRINTIVEVFLTIGSRLIPLANLFFYSWL